MTRIGQTIRAVSLEWVARQCKETVRNGGSCIDDLTATYTGLKPRREPYCAMFVFVCVSEACKRLGIDNHLPKTAGARNMLEMTRNTVIPVTREPAIGAAFYRRSTAPGASGHVGLVADMDGEHLYTIEGNRGDRIDAFTYTWDQVTPANGWEFMRTDRMPGGTAEAGATAGTVSAVGILGLVALLGGLTYTYIRT